MSLTTVEGRYQITERIASGGMGEVYRARDIVLAREVALKVLHRPLADDAAFIDRFRREARAAALLNHPNIVAIYDWGSAEGTYYMVMEYVPGRNLRDLLAAQGHLEAGQVADVMLQALKALGHAHDQGIVHRDVKPENILVTTEGVAKVADFGLARALAESRITQAPGTVTGTVQYLAPEQIHGEPADPRTDIYALGIVGYELLTGRVPYTGETSVAVAYKHVEERVPPPSKAEASVPGEMDRLILWATEKKRDDRPPSADALAKETARVARDLPPASSLAGLVEDSPEIDVPLDGQAPTVTIPRAGPPKMRKRRRGPRVLVWLLVLGLLGGGGWAAWTYLVPRYAAVPDVLGMPESEASLRLGVAGFDVSVGQEIFSSQYDPGEVARQSAAPDSRARLGTDVVIRLSKGPAVVGVPDVTGKTQAQATDALQKAGLVADVKTNFDDNVPKGDVIGQGPAAGKRVNNGTTVTITVSEGPPPVTVPKVTGLAEDDAVSLLRAQGLVVVERQDYSEKVDRGSVISQSVKDGQVVPKGSRLKIVVSLGPRSFPMPDVTGLSESQATSKLHDIGLKVSVSRVPGSTGDRVVGQKPSAGSTVSAKSTVEIFIGD